MKDGTSVLGVLCLPKADCSPIMLAYQSGLLATTNCNSSVEGRRHPLAMPPPDRPRHQVGVIAHRVVVPLAMTT